MRVRWYYAPLLYGLGVLLGLLIFGFRSYVEYRVFIGPFLTYIVLLGAYTHPYAAILWVSLMGVAGALGDSRPRLAALLCVGAGLAVSLFALFIVFPDILRSIG